MTPVFTVINTVLALLLWLLVTRLLVTNWARGGAIVTLMLAFLVLLIGYDVLIAVVAVGLMLLFVPNLARSGIGATLMRGLIAITDPLVDPVRRLLGPRAGTGVATLVAALLVLGARVSLFVALGR